MSQYFFDPLVQALDVEAHGGGVPVAELKVLYNVTRAGGQLCETLCVRSIVTACLWHRSYCFSFELNHL